MKAKQDPKENHVIPEHLINVPLKPKHELRIVARVNALKLFILNSIEDTEAKKEVADTLQQLEDECLEILKKKIADSIREKPFESRFKTQTSEKKKEDGKQSLLAK